jgi:hypothetical protein
MAFIIPWLKAALRDNERYEMAVKLLALERAHTTGIASQGLLNKPISTQTAACTITEEAIPCLLYEQKSTIQVYHTVKRTPQKSE